MCRLLDDNNYEKEKEKNKGGSNNLIVISKLLPAHAPLASCLRVSADSSHNALCHGSHNAPWHFPQCTGGITPPGFYLLEFLPRPQPRVGTSCLAYASS